MDIKSRIYDFLQFSKITPAEFERKTGLSNGYLNNIKNTVGADKVNKIILAYPSLNLEWLITGKGEMLKSSKDPLVTAIVTTKPRIPYTAAAGSITNALDGIKEYECDQIPVIQSFPKYDFTIVVRGDSMQPNILGGDEIACKRINEKAFIQWGKVHVLDTAQGIIVKRIYEDGDRIKCVSYNPEYPPFSIEKKDIYSYNLVVGLLRI